MGLFSNIVDALTYSKEEREFFERVEMTAGKIIELFNNADVWGWVPNGHPLARIALFTVMTRCMYGKASISYRGLNDKNFPIDYHKAIKYGEEAVNCGIHCFGKLSIGSYSNDASNVFVERLIALCYKNLKDYDKAEFWLEKLYEQGVKDALVVTGELYMDRDDGKKDYEKAFKYLEKALKNDIDTKFGLINFLIGRIHYESEGSLSDKSKGLEMIRAAAKEKVREAEVYMNKNGITMGGMLDD